MFDLPGKPFKGSQYDEKNSAGLPRVILLEVWFLGDVGFLLLTRVSSQSLARCIIFGLY